MRTTQYIVAAVLSLFVQSAWGGIGDELNTSIKGLRDLQFSPMEGKVMRCVGVFGDTGFVQTVYFINGVEEGRAIARLNKGPLDTKIMNKVARGYGEWRHIKSEGKIKYFYCDAHGGIWSHYNTVDGYPTWFIYSQKLTECFRRAKGSAGDIRAGPGLMKRRAPTKEQWLTLRNILSNGWGDGDYADNPAEARKCARALCAFEEWLEDRVPD